MQRDELPGRMAFETFVRERCGVSREDFERASPSPLLVQLNDPDAARGLPASSAVFGTICIDSRAAEEGLAPLHVHAVRKKSANPFASMITVGRAANNDIILGCDEVSKFHAFFLQTASGWSIVDAQSTNGTFVNGERLAPNVARQLVLASGPVELAFAAVRARLYAPARFWELARLDSFAPAI